ncbi:MAG: hypothetical protein E4H28_07250 [Gemmatimonadales bacterium]|nr:MAG: hypothetical protein E4H28_07250 [Gemmatimonadales bacterium]
MSKTISKVRVFTKVAETAATGSSNVIEAEGSEIILAAQVVDVSGTTPTLIFEVKYSVDGDTWFSAATPHTMTTITATPDPSLTTARFALLARFARVEWAIGGTDTPTFTFTVDAVVH